MNDTVLSVNTVKPFQIDLKKLTAANGQFSPEKKRVILNIIRMGRENSNCWPAEFSFQKYYQLPQADRQDEKILDDLVSQGWLSDHHNNGLYAVTDELIRSLQDFVIN